MTSESQISRQRSYIKIYALPYGFLQVNNSFQRSYNTTVLLMLAVILKSWTCRFKNRSHRQQKRNFDFCHIILTRTYLVFSTSHFLYSFLLAFNVFRYLLLLLHFFLCDRCEITKAKNCPEKTCNKQTSKSVSLPVHMMDDRSRFKKSKKWRNESLILLCLKHVTLIWFK